MSSSSVQARDPGSWAESLGLYTGLLLQSSGEWRTHRGTDHRQLESSSRLQTQDGLHGARGHMPRRVAALHLPGKSLLEAATCKNRLQVSRNGQAPHRTPTSPSLSQAGAGRGAGDEARAEGLLRCPHPCPRPPAAAARAWGSPINDKPLRPIMRSPSQACGAKCLGGGGEGSIFRGEEGGCQAFSIHSQNIGSSGRDLSQNS